MSLEHHSSPSSLDLAPLPIDDGGRISLLASSISRLALGAISWGREIKSAAEKNMPDYGNNVDLGLLMLDELDILYVSERWHTRDADGNDVYRLHPKFKTILDDEKAEKERQELRLRGEPVKGVADSRTKRGKVLEATSLDELPTVIGLFRRVRYPGSSKNERQLYVRGTHRPGLKEELMSEDMELACQLESGMTRDEVLSSPHARPCILPVSISWGLRNMDGTPAKQMFVRALLTPRSEYPPVRKLIKDVVAPGFRKQTSYHRAKQQSSTSDVELGWL